MGALIDLTGQRFGRWLVLRRAGSDKWKQIKWSARCDCGSEKDIVGKILRSGDSRSCGCWQRRIAIEVAAAMGKANETHGMTKSPEYVAWQQADQRTGNPKNAQWENYGGRGIDMCPEWQGPGGFERFYEHIGPKPDPDYSLDRIDNDKGYWPGNVRWTDRSTQQFNRRGCGERRAA